MRKNDLQGDVRYLTDFFPNGLSMSIQVWIKFNSHGKIIKKLETTNEEDTTM